MEVFTAIQPKIRTVEIPYDVTVVYTNDSLRRVYFMTVQIIDLCIWCYTNSSLHEMVLSQQLRKMLCKLLFSCISFYLNSTMNTLFSNKCTFIYQLSLEYILGISNLPAEISSCEGANFINFILANFKV